MPAFPDWAPRVLCMAAWCTLMGIQFGVRLDMGSPQARRFDTPITPAGYAFSIWGIIFLMQGVATLMPLLGSATRWTHPYQNTVYLWVVGWATESAWTITQAVQQQQHAGNEQASAFWFAEVCLLVGHVAMALALADAVRITWSARAKGDSAAVWPGCLLYVVPSALNAGWLGLASCLGLLCAVIAQTGASYASLLQPGLVLLPLAAATVVAQPWCGVPPIPAPPGGGRPSWKAAISALRVHLVAVGVYAATIMWGLAAVLVANRPDEVHTEATALLVLVPLAAVAGLGVRAGLAMRKAPQADQAPLLTPTKHVS